jgi:hypothetical protein
MAALFFCVPFFMVSMGGLLSCLAVGFVSKVYTILVAQKYYAPGGEQSITLFT